MDFLQLADKTIVVFGVANKKSVAWHIGKTLEESGATGRVCGAQRRTQTIAG